MCDVAGYGRCLILGVDGATRQQERGRAGKGIKLADPRQVQQLLTDVPVLSGSAPFVLQPEQVTALIPLHFVELFVLKGTLIALPLGDRHRGLLGIVIIGRGGAWFTPADRKLKTLVDFTDLATLALQKVAMVHDNQRLATVLEHTRFAIELHDGVTQADAVFSFSPVAVSIGDSVTLMLSFTYSSGNAQIATVYSQGNPGGTFQTSNPCSASRGENSTLTGSGLRAVVYGTS